MFADRAHIGVLKIDVEGHEAAVLQGAASLLARHGIRDIVFEEHGSHPTNATRLLEGYGYALFRLRQRFLGLSADPAGESGKHGQWDPPSYLATTDPDRATVRLAPRGWAVLGAASSRVKRGQY
jgi:hypothetical protein